MRKFYFYLVFISLFSFATNAQTNLMTNGDFESWTDATTPTDWALNQNVAQESTTKHGGDYSLAHTSDPVAKKLKQIVPGVTVGQDYTISFWYYDNTDAAKIKLASAWVDAGGATVAGSEAELQPATFNPDDAEWHQYSAIVTAPADAAKMKVFIKVLAQGDNSGGTVYYDDFYFGDVIATPEPANHVTDFTAHDEVLNLPVTWTLPTTGQLPNGFLVVGAKAGSTASVPVDGTPVADDLDWSDGLFAINMVSDATKHDFSDLEGNTQYTFSIYPYTNAGAYIDYKTDAAPTSMATTADATMISFEGFESGTSGNWTSFNISGAEDWIFPDFKGRHTAKIDGESLANENWLVSPELDLSGLDNTHFSFTNTQISGDGVGNALELFISTNFDGTDIASATWTPLTSATGFNEDIDLTSYVGNASVYVAFKYTSDDAVESAVYKLDNMQVYKSNAIGVNNIESNLISIYPNPANNFFTLTSNKKGNINLFDATGRIILTTNINEGTNNIELSNIEKGIYFVNIVFENGRETTTKLLIK